MRCVAYGMLITDGYTRELLQGAPLNPAFSKSFSLLRINAEGLSSEDQHMTASNPPADRDS